MPTTASDQSASPVLPADAEQQAGGADDGEIVVTGLRRSLESAASIKRNSDGIVDAIVAEDIGKLPDTFASAALARVSGITVTRGAGEATGVRVRGLPDLSTTYNGREIFTAEGRSVAIQDFPAGSVAALEVYKSSTANLIEGGIGGQVNVRGRRPFDFKGFQLSGSLNGVAWEQSGGTTWNGNILVSDRWKTGIGEMGLLVNVSYVGLNYLDATREQSVVLPRSTAAQTPGQAAGLRYPDAQGMFLAYAERWRPSANAAFQWRPSSDLEIYADGLFQGYRSHSNDRYMFFPIFGAGLQLTDVTLREGSTNLIESATVTGGSVPNGNWRAGMGKTDTYQGGAGFIWSPGSFRLSGDVAYTDSTFEVQATNIDFALATTPVRNVVFGTSDGDGPTWNLPNYDLTNPANYIDRGLFQERLLVSGKDIQSRLDAQYEFEEGLIRRLQLGIRYNDRDASRDRGAPYINSIGGVPLTTLRIPVTALPVQFSPSPSAFDFDNVFPIRTFAGLTYDAIRDNVAELRAFHGAPEGLPAFSPTENFRANEKAYAIYAQAKYQIDLNDTMSIDGVVGLRAVRTKTRVSGFDRVTAVAGQPAVDTPVSVAREYDDYLPNASARIRFTPELQMRLAYTQTRTRPGFFDLNPGLTVNAPPVVDPNNPPNPNNPNSNLRTATGGNPDLVPLTSNNYDIGLEWYFSRSGSLTGSLFRRDAKGFIARIPTNIEDPTYGLIRVTRPENISETRFQGFEVAFTSFLDIEALPTWARSFGVQANVTYLDASGPLAGSIADSVNVAGQSLPFGGTSDWIYNLVALYERPTFSARLAYNYRSEFVTGYSIEAQDTNAAGQALTNATLERGRGTLDMSATVSPIPNVTLAFDVNNLLANPIRRYRRFGDAGDEYARQFIYNDRVYSLGVRFRF
ncbi:TonB-dependent receptor [Sphingomonas sp. ac-8]|uniref:TonB-dependent receptor n=1 Tax=Sphingomonas sp. ac-8 TaxID=3242977 RepID=UPI003A80CC70